MIDQAFSTMMTLLFMKFMLNDVPHAIGLFNNPNKKLYHVSPTPDLKILMPSMPAEDIINGEVIWDVRYAGFVSGKIGLPESSKCVCFAAKLKANLGINPPQDGYGYIYIPETNEVPRAIWKEVKEKFKDVLTVDLVSVKEYRFYKPVPIRLVGDVQIEGSDVRINWYPEQPKSRTRYHVFLEHKEPTIAEFDRRNDNIHEDYTSAYSREQAMIFVQRRGKWGGYRSVRAVEV